MHRAESGSVLPVEVSSLRRRRVPEQTVFHLLLPWELLQMGPSSACRVHGVIQLPWDTITLDPTGPRRGREVGAGSQCVHRVVRI
jgi:hypothetical protein